MANQLGTARKRLSARLSAVVKGTAVISLGVFLALEVNWALGPPPLVIVASRSMSSLLPPFQYDADLFRLAGTVLLPLCPPMERASVIPAPGLGTCQEKADGVTVEIPYRETGWEHDWLSCWKKGSAGEASTWSEWKQVLSAPKGGGQTLTFLPLENEPSVFLRQRLSLVFPVQPKGRAPSECPALAAREQEQADKETCESLVVPEGPGPYKVTQTWRKCSRTPAPEEVPPSLQSYATDLLVLEKRLLPLKSFGKMVFMSLEGEDLDTPLSKALDAGEVHLVHNMQRDLYTSLASARRGPKPSWRLSERPREPVLIASLNTKYDAKCRDAARKVLSGMGKDVFWAADATPVLQPLPARFALLRPPHPPRLAARDDGKNCTLKVLTNTSWGPVAEAIAQTLRRSGFLVWPQALPTKEERSRRTTGDYDLSLIAGIDNGEPPALFLYNLLKDTTWNPKHLPAARECAAMEASKGSAEACLNNLLIDLEPDLVPIGMPGTYNAVHDSLLGIRETSSFLDLPRLGLKRELPWYMALSRVVAAVMNALALVLTVLQTQRVRITHEAMKREIILYRHQSLSPLTAIRSLGQFVEYSNPEVGGAIVREANAGIGVILRTTWLLQRSRIEEGSKDARTDLVREVLEPGLADIRQYATSKNLAPCEILLVPPDPVLPPVQLNRDAAAHVLRNLLDNAVRYRQGEEVHITVTCYVVRARTRWWRRKSDMVRLGVQDRGMGIDKSTPERTIFRMGGRTPEAEARDVTGSGAGLAICRSILRAVGGEIRLTSRGMPTGNHPTEFTLWIPAATKEEADDPHGG